MLDTTGTQATAELVNYTGDSGKATDILIDILPKSAGDAQNDLVNKYHLTADQAKNVIQYTHPDKVRPVLFVASSDLESTILVTMHEYLQYELLGDVYIASGYLTSQYCDISGSSSLRPRHSSITLRIIL